MAAPGRLHLPRVLGAPLLFLLGLLLALPPGAQGLPGVPFSSSVTRGSRQHRQELLAHDTLKPAAHLVGDSSFQNALHWKVDRDHAFLQGFSLNNDSLLIPTSGLYFVYSQVVFSGAGCFDEALCSFLYLTHEVQLLSPMYPYPMSLLSAHRSVYPGMREPWMCSMYQGAVFQLNKGDQLFTHTDGVLHLYIRSSNVFFGAFAL